MVKNSLIKTNVITSKSKSLKGFSWLLNIKRILKSLLGTVLLILIPIILAFVLMLPLINNTKSTQVNIQTSSNSLGFNILSGWQSGQDIELLKSISSNSIRIWIDSIIITGGTLTSITEGSIIEGNDWKFLSRGDNAWLHLSTPDKILLLRSLYVDIGSRIFMQVANDKLFIEINPINRMQGDIIISRSDSVFLNTYNFTLQNRKKNSTLTDIEMQERYIFKGDGRFMPFFTSENIKIEIDLNKSSLEELENIFSNYLKISELVFYDTNQKPLLPLISGNVSFRGMNRSTINLENEFVLIHAGSEINLVSLNVDSKGFETYISGKIKSIHVGKDPSPDFEIMPTWLEWIYEQQKLAIIISSLAWLSGTIIGAVKLLNTLKNMEVKE